MDLELFYEEVDVQEELADDLMLILSFAPPLRGGLVVWCLSDTGLLEDMIDLFGGSNSGILFFSM